PLGAANTWTLISLPAMPVWDPGTTWATAPGTVGYYLNIVLAAGSGIQVAANNTWQSTAAWAPAGISNFAAQPVNSTFDLAFIQHEPGALCTSPMELDFATNYDRCLRYYQKTYDYGTAIGALTVIGIR